MTARAQAGSNDKRAVVYLQRDRINLARARCPLSRGPLFLVLNG